MNHDRLQAGANCRPGWRIKRLLSGEDVYKDLDNYRKLPASMLRLRR